MDSLSLQGDSLVEADQPEQVTPPPPPETPEGFAQCPICKGLFKEKGVRVHITKVHGCNMTNLLYQVGELDHTAHATDASPSTQTAVPAKLDNDDEYDDFHNDEPQASQDPATASPPIRNRTKCQLCGGFKTDMKRHIKAIHPGIWDPAMSVRDMFLKATPFPDPDELEVNYNPYDDADFQDEYLQVVFPTASGDSDVEMQDVEPDGVLDQPDQQLAPVTEKVRHGWMSFGRD